MLYRGLFKHKLRQSAVSPPAPPGPPMPSANWFASMNSPTWNYGSPYGAPQPAPVITAGGGAPDPLGGTNAKQIVWSASLAPNPNMVYGKLVDGGHTMTLGATYVIRVQIYSTVAFDTDAALNNYGSWTGYNCHVSLTHTGSGWETLGGTFVASANDAAIGAIQLAFGSLVSGGRQLAMPSTTMYLYDWEIGPV